jgi:hypothetical protein
MVAHREGQVGGIQYINEAGYGGFWKGDIAVINDDCISAISKI